MRTGADTGRPTAQADAETGVKCSLASAAQPKSTRTKKLRCGHRCRL